MGLPLARLVPVVDLRLKRRTPLQQRAVFRCVFMEQFRKPLPEGGHIHASPGKCSFFYEIGQFHGDVQPAALHAFHHGALS
jgi:hypothetical protein